MSARRWRWPVDPETLNTRVNNGKGLPGQEIFQDTSRWHNDVAPIGVDPAKAKELLDQAKADGYDGKITFLSIQEPSAQATGSGHPGDAQRSRLRRSDRIRPPVQVIWSSGCTPITTTT